MADTDRMPHAAALAIAEEFCALFDPASYARWEFAGSLRRGKATVKDIEHVIIPRWEERAPLAALFGEAGPYEHVNLLWLEAARLLATGQIAKAVYDNHKADGSVVQNNRWGQTYRGIDYGGVKHELFLADADNWGVIFGIRTGSGSKPAQNGQPKVVGFAERVMTNMLRGGVYRIEKGRLTLQETGHPVPCPDEHTWLAAAGMAWVEPQERN